MTLGRSLLLLKPRMRHVHAHLVTMPQSGTHWLCYMLALALSRTFDVPGPAHIADRQQSLRSELLFRNLREAIVSQDEKKRPLPGLTSPSATTFANACRLPRQ